jgi:hypothetical protein
MRAFALGLLEHGASDDTLRGAAQAALEGPTDDLRFALLFAIVANEPFDLSLTDELEEHWTTTQGYGCEIGGCGDSHPGESTVGRVAGAASLAVPASSERTRMLASGKRIDAIGELVIAFAEAHEGDPRTPELLHRFVRLTRRASIHASSDRLTGILSRRAFDLLHQRHSGTPWANLTQHWYR